MAKLTTTRRNALPAKAFAGKDHTYPIPDRAHAADAKARATQAVKAGRMPASEKRRIDTKAHRVLSK